MEAWTKTPEPEAELRTTWRRSIAAQMLAVAVPAVCGGIIGHMLVAPSELRWSFGAGVTGVVVSQSLLAVYTRRRCTLRLYKGRVYLGEGSGVPARDLDLELSRRTSWRLTLLGRLRMHDRKGRPRFELSRLWYTQSDFDAFLARCREVAGNAQEPKLPESTS